MDPANLDMTFPEAMVHIAVAMPDCAMGKALR